MFCIIELTLHGDITAPVRSDHKRFAQCCSGQQQQQKAEERAAGGLWNGRLFIVRTPISGLALHPDVGPDGGDRLSFTRFRRVIRAHEGSRGIRRLTGRYISISWLLGILTHDVMSSSIILYWGWKAFQGEFCCIYSVFHEPWTFDFIYWLPPLK